MRREALPPPQEATERRRLLFDPARGPVRRTERRLSNFLHLHLYPRFPRLGHVYERQLRLDLVLSTAEISLGGLPDAFEGLRVLLLTDVHAGPFVRPPALRRLFRGLLLLRPDLLLLAGDVVTRRAAELEACREAFRTLRAPLGAFAVLGNHDHYTRAPDRLAGMIENCGIRVLRNRSAAIERDGSRLWLAGVDDLLMGAPDLDAALAGTRDPVILLSHSPDLFFRAARRGVALTLSGHTHAGQIRLRGLPVIVRQSRFRLDEGRYRRGASELLVSRGLGAVGLPLRVHCPPEAVLLTLRRGEGGVLSRPPTP